MFSPVFFLFLFLARDWRDKGNRVSTNIKAGWRQDTRGRPHVARNVCRPSSAGGEQVPAPQASRAFKTHHLHVECVCLCTNGDRPFILPSSNDSHCRPVSMTGRSVVRDESCSEAHRTQDKRRIITFLLDFISQTYVAFSRHKMYTTT